MVVPDSGPLELEELAREAYYGEYNGSAVTFPITPPIALYDLVNGGNSAGSGMSYPAINQDCEPNPADRLPSSTPTLTTTSVSSITTSTASSGGTSVTENGSSIVVKGVFWTDSLPWGTGDIYRTTDGSGTANFTSSITNLAPNTTYYVRAYATNSSGTGVGETLSFQTATLPVTGLTWTTTKVNPCSSAPWVISAGNQTIRYNVVDSVNCGGTCSATQSGTATATITVGNSATNLNLDFEGLGELQDADYEKITFKLNGTLVARAQAQGGQQGCAMGPVVKTFITNPPYALSANSTNTLLIEFTTNDGKFHIGAYYEVELSFS
jgi:hypothetical protein